MAFTTVDRIKNRMVLAGTGSVDTTALSELLEDSHAEIISILRDYDLDADDIDDNLENYPDYKKLIGAETKLCIGVWYMSRPAQNEFVKYTMKSPHPDYQAGLDMVRDWAQNQVENAFDDSIGPEVVKSPMTSNTDFTTDYYE